MKISHAAILALALPMSLLAQQPSAGPPANPITTAFRGRTLGLQRSLAQAFDSIPEAKFGYKPTPAQLSIGHIAQHLAEEGFMLLWADSQACLRDQIPERKWSGQLVGLSQQVRLDLHV